VKGYEFTGLGWVVIVILVIALIALPISVIYVRSLDSPPDDEHPGIYVPTPDPGDDPGSDPGNDPGSEPGNEPGSEPGSEPGNGSGNEPGSEPGNGSGSEPGSEPGNGSGSEPVEEPEPGPIDINVADGTMSFLFAPEMQDSIDTETVSMMGDFLKSPVNTRTSRIIARIPNLDEDDTAVVVDAITAAFAQHGVSQNRLSYVVYPSGTASNVFEISFSFERITNQK
jgi:hypothetical protein